MVTLALMPGAGKRSGPKCTLIPGGPSWDAGTLAAPGSRPQGLYHFHQPFRENHSFGKRPPADQCLPHLLYRHALRQFQPSESATSRAAPERTSRTETARGGLGRCPRQLRPG